MRIATKTINLYLNKALTTDQIVEAFNRTEVEVEEIIKSNPWDEKIVIGETVSVAKHPQADRLKLVGVKIGNNKLINIICAAQNVDSNQRVVVAMVGATLPDGTKIEKKVMRGEESVGMLCSEAELGISPNHSGILVLDHSTPIGKKLCDVWPSGDVLDIKTPPNRWDFNSIVGLCREISVYSQVPNLSLKLPDTPQNTYDKIEREFVKKTGKCSRFILVKMRVNNSQPSPNWLVDNLAANGLRSISPVVDITNYIMLEHGQPSHAYDARKVSGELQVRFASPGECLTTIDGEEHDLSKDDLVIADSAHVLGLAGVIGGQLSEVDRDTSEIYLEVATFDKTIVRKTALRHSLRTEASARFERGLPLPLPSLAADRIIELLKKHCNAEMLDSPTDQLYGWPWVQHIGLSVRKAEKLIGISVDEALVVNGLRKLGFEVEHFSLSMEAKRYLGTPYKFGARFREDGISAFDCSYLTEYIYSRIGVMIGHTAKQQYDNGRVVNESELKPGDLLFYSGTWKRLKATERGDIGHNGMYIGKNKVLEAVEYKYNPRTKKYERLKSPQVILSPLTDFVNNPSYKGARRYIDNFNHILAITAPWWRNEIRLEEDMVEEIIKLIGYDNLPATLPQLPPQNVAGHETLPYIMDIRRALVDLGFFEIMTYSLVGKNHLEKLDDDPSKHLQVANPLSVEQKYLRSRLLASSLTALEKNIRYDKEFGWFEISKVFERVNAPMPVREHWQLAVLWLGSSGDERLRGVLSRLNKRIDQKLKLQSEDMSLFVPERATQVVYKNEILGNIGQLDPKILPKRIFAQPVWYLEMNIEPIIIPADPVAPNMIAHQLIERDITIEVDSTLAWSRVVDVLVDSISNLQLRFDSEYWGDTLSSGKKAITFKVIFDCGSNPSQGDIESIIKQITTSLAKSLDAKIR